MHHKISHLLKLNHKKGVYYTFFVKFIMFFAFPKPFSGESVLRAILYLMLLKMIGKGTPQKKSFFF